MDSITHPSQKKIKAKIGSIWLGGFPGAEIIENLAQRKRALSDYEIVLLLDKASEKILKKTFYGRSLKMAGHANGLLDATTDLSAYDYLKNVGVILERYEVMMERVKKSYHHHEANEIEINKLFSQMEPMIKESRRGFGDLAEISDMLRIVFLADSENIEKGVAYFDADLFFKKDKAPGLMQKTSLVSADKFDEFLTVNEEVGFKIPYIKGVWGNPQINNNIMIASPSKKAKDRLLAILKRMVKADHLMRQAYFTLDSGTKINLLSIKKTVADLSPILEKKKAIQLVSDYEIKDNKRMLDTNTMFSAITFKDQQEEKQFFREKEKVKVERLLSEGKPLSLYYLLDQIDSIKVTVKYQDIVNILRQLEILHVVHGAKVTPGSVEKGIDLIGGERILYSNQKKEYSIKFYSDSKIELHLALRWYFPIIKELSKSIREIPKDRKGSYFDFIKPRLFKKSTSSLAIPSLLKPFILITDKDLRKISLEEDVSRRGLSWASARKKHARSDALSGEEMFCTRPGLIKRDLGSNDICKSIKKNNLIELQKNNKKPIYYYQIF